MTQVVGIPEARASIAVLLVRLELTEGDSFWRSSVTEAIGKLVELGGRSVHFTCDSYQFVLAAECLRPAIPKVIELMINSDVDTRSAAVQVIRMLVEHGRHSVHFRVCDTC